MNKKTVSDAITNINSDYIEQAADYTVVRKSRKSVFLKWGTVAACFAVVAALGVGLFQSDDIVTLDSGEKIVFERSNTLGGALSLAFEVIAKPLTAAQTKAVFGDLPITADAIYKNNDIDADASRELIGFEGEIGNVKAVISTSDVPLRDTVIVGREENSTVDGVGIVAGYVVTEPNSKGEQNVIYYARFELGDCEVYLENGGTKVDSEIINNELAEVIEKLIENGEPNLNWE